MADKNSISIRDLAWAAGFLEGEGSFGCHGGTTRVSAGQVQKEPLDRLVKLFGGRMWLKPPTGMGKHPVWTWVIPGKRSAAVMMTIYTFMSQRRKEQIESALSVWRNSRRLRDPGSVTCLRGHSITGTNAVVVPGRTYPICRMCKNSVRQAWRKRARLSS